MERTTMVDRNPPRDNKENSPNRNQNLRRNQPLINKGIKGALIISKLGLLSRKTMLKKKPN